MRLRLNGAFKLIGIYKNGIYRSVHREQSSTIDCDQMIEYLKKGITVLECVKRQDGAWINFDTRSCIFSVELKYAHVTKDFLKRMHDYWF